MNDFNRDDKLQYKILQLLPSGVGVYDVTGNEVRKEYLNDGYYQMIGATREKRHQYDGTKTVFAVHKDDAPGLIEEAHLSITQHRMFQYRFRILTGEGSYKWIAISANHTPVSDKTERFYAAYYDIDEMVRAEEKLRSDDIMFSDLLKYSDITHFTYYPREHRYEIMVLPEKLSGMPKIMEDYPESFIEFSEMNEEDAENYREMIRKINSGAQEAECTFQAKYMGKYTWYKVHLLNFLDEAGEPVRAIGNAVIVDQYKLAEKTYNEEWVRMESAQSGLLVGACFNVTKDSILSVKQYTVSNVKARPFDIRKIQEEALAVEPETAVQKKETLNALLASAAQIPDKQEREQFIKYCSHAGMTRLYESGEREIIFEYRRWIGDKLLWVSTRIALLINPTSEEVLAFFYTSDINDSMVFRKITSQIIDINYETVSYYDANTGNMNLQKDNSGFVFITIPYENAISEAMSTYVIKNEIEETRTKFNLNTIIHRLSTDPVYSIYYTENERDESLPGKPHKRMKCDVFYLDGTKDIIVFLQTNVTEIYEQERVNREAMASALQAAESANIAKGEFISRISHDIRTPISIIMSMTKFAFEDMDDSEKLKADLSKIETANTYLLSLINDVLDISKIDSGKIELDPKPYTYEIHTQNILNVMEALCDEKGIHHEYEHRRNTGVIVADQVRLNQIILNVLSNAVKYTPEGGTVKYISDSEDLPDNKLRFGFEVVDNGIGMSEDFQKRMFEPFSQEYDNPHRPKGITGTGLGLSIVKKMVDIMGGTLTVKSKLGVGTTVRCEIVFPDALRDPKYKDFATGQSKDNVDGNKLSGKVLLAEDNPMNMEIAERIISGFGLTIDSVDNGKKAVEKFSASAPGEYAAILMDIQMPIMNGYEATENIRKLERPDAKTVPIVAMTADAFSDAAERGFAVGMNEYILKPLDPGIIKSTLEKVMGEEK